MEVEKSFFFLDRSSSFVKLTVKHIYVYVFTTFEENGITVSAQNVNLLWSNHLHSFKLKNYLQVIVTEQQCPYFIDL